MNRKKSRQSNIELLRIVAMIMIIFHHIGYYSGFDYTASGISANRLLTQFITYGGHVGVDIFVLIGGYFMMSYTSLKIVKVVRLWLQMMFYSILGLLIGVELFGFEISPKAVGIALIPFLYKQWPFASAYMVLMIISPFINKMVGAFNKKQYRSMLVIMLVMWSAIPTFTTFDGGSNYVTWMVVLYCIGGYVRLYPEDFEKSSRFYLTGAFGVALLSLALTTMLDVMGMKWGFFATYAMHFSGMQHLNVLLWAFLMFMGFARMDINSNAFINYLAGLTFGIYLFHEDYYLREVLWKQVFDSVRHSDKWYLIFYIAFQVAVVFAAGAVIEILRRLLEKYPVKIIGRLLEPIQEKIDGELWQK